MVEIVRRSASEDPQGRSTKFLTFEQNSWEWAAGVALALERSGYSFAITPRWSFIFGARHAADLATALRNGEVALWTIKSPASGDTWISNSRPAIDPAQAEIAFSGAEGNAQAFVIGGWEVSNGPFSWSTEKSALLYFTATPASADVQIDFHVFPFNFSSDRVQRMSVSFNNEFTQTFEVARNGIQSMRVPFEVWNRRPCATLAFDFPDATSPKAAGQSADERLLGCGFTRIAFHPYHAVSTIVPRLETKTASLNALAIESTRRAVNVPAFVNDD
jgi:hypothetical protein